MSINEWKGCSAEQCPYGKEYGDCDTCRYIIYKDDTQQNDTKTQSIKFAKGDKYG